jgi:hypothetical protein
MAPADPSYRVVRVTPGAATGDSVYLLERSDGSRFHVAEPLGTVRVEVVEEGGKFGPQRVRLR